MEENVKKLIEAFTDPDMTEEGRASVLAYARGRLDAQKEFNRRIPVRSGSQGARRKRCKK